MTRKQIVSDEQAEELVKQLYERASSEQPSTQLDTLILQQAQDAVAEQRSGAESVSKANPLQFWQRFGSIAATLVLVVTLGLLYQTNRGALAPEDAVRLLLEPRALSAETPATAALSAPAVKSEEVAKQMMEPQPEQVAVESIMAVEQMADIVGVDDLPGDGVASNQPANDQPALEVSTPPEREAPAVASKAMLAEENADLAEDGSGAALLAPASMSREVRAMTAEPDAALHDFSQSAQPAPEKMSRKLKNTSGWDWRIELIRSAIAGEDVVQARELWQQLQADFPNAAYPEDLIQFFGNDR